MIDIIAQGRQSLASHVPTAIITLTLSLVALAALSLGIRFVLGGSRPVIMSAIYVIAYVIVISMMIDYDRPGTGFVTVSLVPITDQLQSMQRSQ
jgi:MFS superfamily sulfate permease-like transporter